MQRFATILVFVTFALAAQACSGSSDPDCSGDGVITSESHWANCGNGSTNVITSNNTSASDAGSFNSGNSTTNNGAVNNSASDAGNEPDVGSDAGPDASDGGMDAGQSDSCYAFRWNDTDRAFDEARCTDTGAGTFECSCFDQGDIMSIAIVCDQALAECGATLDEVEGCSMTDEAGCTRSADGDWECTCQGVDGVFTSDFERCDTAYYSSCYADNFCVAESVVGTGRCTPTLDQDFLATGYTCACFDDGVEVKPEAPQQGASCVDDATAYCSEL